MPDLALPSSAQMRFTVRPAVIADVPAMHGIRMRVRENRLADPGRITEASYLPFVAGAAAWVADTGVELLGFAAADQATSSVWALFVAPEAEGRGVGRELHAAIIQWARQLGLPRLSLSTAGGSRAERFYQQADWRRIGLTPDGETAFQIDPRA